MNLIEINSLTKDFGTLRAVDDLSFAIGDGEGSLVSSGPTDPVRRRLFDHSSA